MEDENTAKNPTNPAIFCYAQFNKPLIPAPTEPPKPELKARDVVPLREAPVKKPPRRAEALFRDEVKATVQVLVSEIKQLFGEDISAAEVSVISLHCLNLHCNILTYYFLPL